MHTGWYLLVFRSFLAASAFAATRFAVLSHDLSIISASVSRIKAITHPKLQ